MYGLTGHGVFWLASYCRDNMVTQRDTGHYQISFRLSEDLGEKVKDVVENNPEMTDARLGREAIRHELQKYEHEEYNDD